MSKVVFVGNVPYDMGEKQLIEVFKTVGNVVGFRLVVDRHTGKPKGYGFCEFMDHETAASAVRNLHGTDCGGRPLRIDLADSDPFLEGKTTVNGEIVDGGETRAQWKHRHEQNEPDSFMRTLPQGVPLPPGISAGDAISNTLATINPTQLTEVLAQMKAFVINYPDQARQLLSSQPQLSYALFQALLLNKIVDPTILQRMLAATQSGAPPRPPQMTTPNVPNLQNPGMGRPPHPSPSVPPPIHQSHYYQGPPVAPPSTTYAPPPMQAPSIPPPSSTPTHSVTPQFNLPEGIDPSQRAMLQSVLALSPEKIQSLPPNEREAILMLRAQFLPPGN